MWRGQRPRPHLQYAVYLNESLLIEKGGGVIDRNGHEGIALTGLKNYSKRRFQMKKLLFLFMLSCLIIAFDQAYAASAKIVGKVLDVNGKSVAGVKSSR